MYITCLDLEGVLVPEIWIAFAEKTGIDELRLTTRDISDYDVLMKKRLGILKEHSLGLQAIQDVIAQIDPMPGAKDFLDALRENCQVIILSDTFTQPLIKKLGMPAIFCNELIVGSEGMISGYKLRQKNGKYHAVCALQSIGFNTIAAGDSFNDLAMIKQSTHGFLFRAPEHIASENPAIPALSEYGDLLNEIIRILKAES